MAKKTGSKAELNWLNGKASIMSPIGVARFPYINKPSTKFDPCFKTDLVVDIDSKEFKAFIASLKKMCVAEKVDPTMVDGLVKEAEEKDGSTVHFLAFKTTANVGDDGKYRTPGIFNSKGETINQTVWGGDLIRVRFKLAKWKNSLGSGLKFYLGDVQLLKKNAQANAGSPMDAVEGYEAIESVVDTGNAAGVNPATLPDNNDGEDDEVI